ncbi:DUF1804 family protein [Vibrio mediterranei]|uniref:DUF1804 family protein n=1 Tax=Vibrio mediterranei TaxID=689 RepID=UPI0038CE4F46
MAYSKQIKTKVKEDYLNGMTITQAAKKNGVSVPTAHGWKKKNREDGCDWSALRRESVSGNLISSLDDFCIDLVNEIENDESMSTKDKIKNLAEIAKAKAMIVKAEQALHPSQYMLSAFLDAAKDGQRKLADAIEHKPSKVAALKANHEWMKHWIEQFSRHEKEGK